MSRAILRQALAVLEEGGVVRRVPGRGGGTFVAEACAWPARAPSQSYGAGGHCFATRVSSS